MDTTFNQERKCCVCSLVLIPGDNIHENEYKSFIDSNPDIQEVATARGVVELNIKKNLK